MLKRLFSFSIIIFLILWLLPGCHPGKTDQQPASDSLHSEVMYHIFLRSFYDSNGDHIGDLNGVKEKLGYLQQLGITSILITPIVQSVYYHNYFADNFKKIDPEYGTMEDWISLVKAVHQHDMKIYLDQEFQYVTGKQKWFKDSYKNPKSPYSDYLIYHDTVHNTDPEPIIYNISVLPGYNDSSRKVATVNLYNKNVQDYFYQLLKYWIDPNADGNFNDGVDGFRLDHLMNDLDNKGILTNLFSKFWCPLITKLKKINPGITIIAEQANWASYGTKYFKQGCVDRIFAFNLRYAIASFDKSKIAAMADSTFSHTPAGKQQIVFIENHDMPRFASVVKQNPGKLRIGATLNLLIGGIPSIYYGQELGMFGIGGFGKFGNTDGNDIPQREAFEWFKADSGNGMAIWYKNTGPWWDSTNLKPNDDVSLQEEKNDPGSLWNFYKDLIHLHTSNAALTSGKYVEIKNDNDKVFSFIRYTDDSTVLVAINLSGTSQPVTIDLNSSVIKWNEKNKLVNLFGKIAFEINEAKLSLQLPAYSTKVWEIEKD